MVYFLILIDQVNTHTSLALPEREARGAAAAGSALMNQSRNVYDGLIKGG